MVRKLLLTLGLLAVLLIPTAVLAGPIVARELAVGRELAAVRQATAKYHDVQAALDDGFAATDECVPGMGFHYARMDRVLDGVVNPLEPEVLIYTPQEDGTRRLVAVEYVVVTNDSTHPTIFSIDKPLDGPKASLVPGFARQFDLHAWIWQGNPDGVFTAHNPNSSCQ